MKSKEIKTIMEAIQSNLNVGDIDTLKITWKTVDYKDYFNEGVVVLTKVVPDIDITFKDVIPA